MLWFFQVILNIFYLLIMSSVVLSEKENLSCGVEAYLPWFSIFTCKPMVVLYMILFVCVWLSLQRISVSWQFGIPSMLFRCRAYCEGGFRCHHSFITMLEYFNALFRNPHLGSDSWKDMLIALFTLFCTYICACNILY